MTISKTVENWIGYGIAVAILVLFAWALCGCACDRAAYVRQSCTSGTNICLVVIMPEGGAAVLPMGDSAIKAAVDDFRIYSRALTSTEVTSLYNSGNGTEGQ